MINEDTNEKECPVCGKRYIPDLVKRYKTELLIQDEYPKASACQREQLLTGICSDKCWNKICGVDVQ